VVAVDQAAEMQLPAAQVPVSVQQLYMVVVDYMVVVEVVAVAHQHLVAVVVVYHGSTM
jgi:hypothetical protein